MGDAAEGATATPRAVLEASEDPRAARTRDALYAAATALSAEHGAISVRAIVERAGVSRSAFYAHFADVRELAMRMQEPHFAAIAERSSIERAADPDAAMLRAQRSLVAFFDEHRDLYRAAFALAPGGAEEGVAAAMRPAIRAHLALSAVPAGLAIDVVAHYVASAAAHVLRAWVQDELEPRLDAESLAIHLAALVPAWMGEPGGAARTAPPPHLEEEIAS